MGVRQVQGRCHVPPEDGMPGAPLIVDFADGLYLVPFFHESESDLAALILRLGQFRRDVYRRPAVERRVDLVAREWRRQIDLAAGITSRGGEISEIARHHRGRWNVANRGARIRAGFRALISAEEEEFVPHNRSAKRPAVLVSLQRIPDIGKIIPGVELVIADKLKKVAMKFIRARLLLPH